MTFRCTQCHAAVWIQPVQREARKASIDCEGCGRTYVLKAWNRLCRASRKLAERARKVAADRGIDLPSAYSVALGVVGAGKLEELVRSTSSARRTAVVAGPGRTGYDRSFQAAIDQGLLTPQQAIERGVRSAYASIVASRHKLSRSVALDVADNRISLLEAIRRRPADRSAVEVALVQRKDRTAALCAVLALLMIFAVLARNGRQPYAGAEIGRVLGGAQIKADGSGRLLQVLGPTPRLVLRGYCAASDRGRCDPLIVIPSAKPGDRARLGLLRSPERPGELLAIKIREDLESGQWLAGDGTGPLIARSAPPGAEQSVPVR